MPLNEQPDWVDRVLLPDAGAQPCLDLGRPVDRAALRRAVVARQQVLAGAGMPRGGTVGLRMAPGAGFVTTLLAVWRGGAQAVLLDHRLTDAEVDAALEALRPQYLVTGEDGTPTALPGGRPATTDHVVVQLSSGSTGRSKAIGRTAADLERELDRYARLPEFPGRGERVVLLSSLVHVLGLVGGLLNALHSGAELVLPDRMTPAGVLAAVGRRDAPTTIIGVPFHAELLAGRKAPPPLPRLRRMIVAGELVRPGVAEAFTERYGVPLGTMYGMTETGVIATDPSGRLRPWLDPVHGMELSVADGELHIRMPDSPYLGQTDPTRWSEGLLHTRDAASLDPGTGRVTVHGRRDSQVSIGGLKVDLNEVEQTLTALPDVEEAVVLFHDGAIEAYVSGRDTGPERLRELLAERLAGYKLPRRMAVLPALPRTATGKLLRSAATLREHAAGHP
ncbi:class I adenylate-forming enzyme family protein [Actinacidiphila sp. ITFR-21]|uniref:class I adenylate-forming enzyme family protein n=1 Tax=Actinacidiphila sp. ITFR-21 TaxID=3075199 RepID=UPI00288B0185|nr:fatty acid--CoA ligase family protein [Streptomyces sp. ITFR-21]WNI19415.1 fatty acid--CoA ligase family protein [Streptomyces sp. ITFR-21]